MAQVPYNPVPNVQPEAAPVRKLRITTNEDMFGGQIGGALREAGRDISQASNELFSTAIQFKKLDIENEVNNSVSDYLMKSGELDNNFRLLEGKDPQAQLESHKNALNDLRMGIRSKLSSPFAQQMYDRETIRRFGYDVVNASGYAATQAKGYAKQTRQANIDATIDSMNRDPNNDPAIKDGLNKIMTLAGQDSLESGDSSPVMHAKVQVQVGRAVDGIAKSLAKTDPDRAKAFLQNYKDFIHSAQYQETMTAVEDRGLKVNADLEGARIATPLDPILDRAMQVTKDQESGGNYKNVTTTRDKNGNPQSALGAYGIMDRNLPEWSQQVLGRQVSRDEFLNSPQIQDQIYRAKMGEYIRKYGVEGAGRAWIGGEGGVNSPNTADPLGTKVGDYGRVFSTKIGSTVRTHDIDEKGVVQMMQDAELSADRLYPNDPARHQQYLDQLQHNILSHVSVQKKELGDRITALNNAVNQTLMSKGPNGRGPISFMEAGTRDHRFADHYEELFKLDPQVEKRAQAAFMANAKQDIPWTQERENRYTQIVGMSDPELMKVDANQEFVDGTVTQGMANKIMERQAGVKRRAFSNVMADQALTQNGALLNDAQIFKSTTDTAANGRYIQMRGALILRMEEYAQEHNAQMPQKERDELVKSLLKDSVTSKGWLWGNWSKPTYQAMSEAPEIATPEQYGNLPAGAYYKWGGQLRQKPEGNPSGP